MTCAKHIHLHLDKENTLPIDYQHYDTHARELRSSMTLKAVNQARAYIKPIIKKLSRSYQEPERGPGMIEVNRMNPPLLASIRAKGKSSDLAEVLRKISRPASSKIKPSVSC